LNGDFGTIAVEDPAAGLLKQFAVKFYLADEHLSKV